MESEILESNKKLVQYLIQDIIRFSLTIYGVEHTVDVDFYSSLPAEQLISIHRQLRKDYLQSLGVQVEEQEIERAHSHDKPEQTPIVNPDGVHTIQVQEESKGMRH